MNICNEKDIREDVSQLWNLGIAFLLGPISAGYQKDDSKLISPCDLLIALVSFRNLASSIGLHSLCLI